MVTSVQETGVYVHIPFCSRKCNYCDFLSAPGRPADKTAYVNLLEQEVRRFHGRYRADTVFVGGGTPSVLPARLLEKLFALVIGPFLQSDTAGEPVNVEISVEANPESLSREKARRLRKGGATRLSLGVQSFDPAGLAWMGRRHTVAQALKAYGVAREVGFPSVNLDLMYGFPTHSRETWEKTLERAMELRPEHISAYCFIPEVGTRLYPTAEVLRRTDEDEDLQAEMYRTCRQMLSGAGFVQYEISNFSLPGHECRHNIRYWRNQSYLGLGLGAVSFMDGRRRSNAKVLLAYRQQIIEGRPFDWEEEPLSKASRVRESLILGLRLLEGVDPAAVPGNPIAQAEREAIQSVLSRWQRRGLLERVKGRYALTERGLFLSNEVFADLV
jgi:oxygen-independent coproporphyrinogen-3 oxidase